MVGDGWVVFGWLVQLLLYCSNTIIAVVANRSFVGWVTCVWVDGLWVGGSYCIYVPSQPPRGVDGWGASGAWVMGG